MNENVSVQAHPVVAVEVRGGTVEVNGAPVEVSKDADAHTVAVHTVAQRVAQPLGRPVRVVATDDESGTTQLVVHPDGTASNVVAVQGAADERDAIVALEELLSNGQPAAEDPAHTSVGRENGAEPEPTVARSEPRTAPRPTVTERPSFITAGRVVQPATQGWRGAANGLGLRMQPGSREQAYRADVAAVSKHWAGTRTVAVVNAKGSASKTPTAACLSAVFARLGGAGVLAWDNNETEGTLRFRTEWAPHEASLLHLLPRTEQLLAPTAGVAELSNYVHHQPADRYDVLWSDPSIDGDHVVSAEDVKNIHGVASRYYRMVFMDSGNNSRAENWRSMIEHADAIVVPCTEVEDTAEVGARLLETLSKRGGHSAELAENALVVASQRTEKGEELDRITRDFSGLARSVVRIPYDRGLRTGVIRFDNLQASTQRAWLAAAASLAEAL